MVSLSPDPLPLTPLPGTLLLGARESYRQFLASTIQPLARLVVEELAVKLDTPTLALDFTELRAADIASRARAFKQLVDAGMDQAKAASVTGLD